MRTNYQITLKNLSSDLHKKTITIDGLDKQQTLDSIYGVFLMMGISKESTTSVISELRNLPRIYKWCSSCGSAEVIIQRNTIEEA